MRKHKLATWLTCIALAGGIASAAALESLEIALPGGASVSVDAALVPGADGSDVTLSRGVGWIDEVDFSVGFDPDGTVLINGAPAGTTNVGNVHSVHIDIEETLSGYVASVTVRDEDLALVVATGSGIALGIDAPARARARGQIVISLSAQ